jgi:hypothetical protein
MATRRKPTTADDVVNHEAEIEYADIAIDTTNEYALHSGTNMPNHSTTLSGRGKFVRTGAERPIFRTKQAAYRYAAWLLCLAEALPDEDDAVSFEQVLEAVESKQA